MRGEQSTASAEVFPLVRCFFVELGRRKTDFHEECDGVDGEEGACMMEIMHECCFAVDSESRSFCTITEALVQTTAASAQVLLKRQGLQKDGRKKISLI